MAAVHAGSRPAPRDRLYGRDVGGETILLDEVSGDLHTLNPSASLVWRCLDGESTLQEIAADIAEAVDAPASEVLDDVIAMVSRLDEQGLLASSPLPDRQHGDGPEPNT